MSILRIYKVRIMRKKETEYRYFEVAEENLSRWNVSPADAITIQKKLASQVKLCQLPHRIQWVAAADVSYSRESDKLFAAVVLCHLPDLSVHERLAASAKITFPYIPGLLSFRETPLIIELCNRLKRKPEIILCDGQGIAHTRRFGLACHIGLILNLPSIGCAKTKLVGDHKEVGPRKGQYQSLYYRKERVGVALRTRTGVKPIYVSPGHLADIPSSIRLVLRCCNSYRIPEPIRQAHLLANRVRTDVESS